MSLPTPKPGLVIGYSFLWSIEKAQGFVEGRNDRPCVIVVVAVHRDPHGDISTVVAPVTHRPSDDPTASIEIPPQVCRSLGLDDGRHWIRFDELNSFAWPGYDLRPIPGKTGRYDYGMLPPGLFGRLREAILARQKARAGRLTHRT
jgi:hypothetical protein